MEEALGVRELRTTSIAQMGNELIDVESLPQRLETSHDRSAACGDRISPQTGRVPAAAGTRGGNRDQPGARRPPPAQRRTTGSKAGGRRGRDARQDGRAAWREGGCKDG